MTRIDQLNESHGDYRLKIKINEIIDVVNTIESPAISNPIVIPDGGSEPAHGLLPYQPDSTAGNLWGLLADFNTLLANLRTAGLMESES